MVSKIFLDVNVLLDFFFKRQGFESVTQILLLAKRRKVKLYVSSSILQTSAYYLQRSFDPNTCKLLLLELLKLVHIIEASQETIYQALNSSIDDIEDAFHYFTAVKHQMNYLISSDKYFQKSATSSLAIINADEMLTKLL